MHAKIKLALLSGGLSNEREVSLKTGEEIFKALDKNKYEIFRYDPKDDLRNFFNDAFAKKFDVVFPALHGYFGEDGRLQGILDAIGIPYVFSGPLAHALAMNKHMAKIVATHIGLPTAEEMIIMDKNFSREKIIAILNFPIVVKPLSAGSSVGVSIAEDKNELEKGIVEAFKHDQKIMLEKFIKGRELTVPILGNNPPRALPVTEIIPKISAFYDYKAKYQDGGSEHICPAGITAEETARIQEYAVSIFKELGCADLARVDFIFSKEKNDFYFIEINTIPGMTRTSLTPESARAAGLKFSDFLDFLIGEALKRGIF